MKFIPFLLFTGLFLFGDPVIAQKEDLQVGGDALNRQSQGGFYDYSDPETVNIRVSVWGFVKYPGRYIIPGYSNINDLISFAGGPTDDATLDDLRIFRTNSDSSKEILRFDYDELFWGKEAVAVPDVPQLNPGDILMVPGNERLYFKDWFQITLSLVATLISLSILILNIVE